MKRIVYILSIVCLLMMTACDVETSDNGDLDGFWHLQRIESLTNGTTSESIILNQRVFWSVQSSLVQLWNLQDQPIICQFTYEKDVRHLSIPACSTGR